ncbi:CPBP family intramembrane glutamic endopeptidase [Virgibacillus byunsanensis]|uniref:CPBP family intramembrane glutamic endopeptidase n=1 Tax=Virgibacillus byunsanensis TaxID=570945 RepID=A0ABW3LPC2_9BACI
MKQSEIIKSLSDDELKRQLMLSQLLLIIISIVLSFFLFNKLTQWVNYFNWDIQEIFYYGVLSGLLVVLIDIVLIYTLPKRYYDDGGINKRIFKNRTIIDIFVIALIVSISEELLFRGVLQTSFGYIVASVIFAIVHIRYLKKPVLLISVLFVSFYIGYMFVVTENLFVTITAHFIVDFLLGILIRFQR